MGPAHQTLPGSSCERHSEQQNQTHRPSKQFPFFSFFSCPRHLRSQWRKRIRKTEGGERGRESEERGQERKGRERRRNQSSTSRREEDNAVVSSRSSSCRF